MENYMALPICDTFVYLENLMRQHFALDMAKTFFVQTHTGQETL